VTPDEAAQLVAAGAVVLDVRTPREHEELGHIPGALLLPIELVAAAPAVLPDEGGPVVVVCEHGVRSRRAACFLAEAGLASVHNLAGGMSRWTGARVHEPTFARGPSPWLLANVHLAPRGGRTLDVACGRGRHALVLAAAGFPVRAVDRDPTSVARLAALARRLQLPLETAVVDLETGEVDLGDGEWDLVLVFNYLYRPLFPALVRALRPGGVLLYETYLIEPAPHGRPTRPEHRLQPGELRTLVAPLEVLRQREGEFEGRAVASVVARRPVTGASRSKARNQAAQTPRVVAAPKSQRRPAQARGAPSSGRGQRTPGARKR
jgi:rhodanese-related sulfurtransferase